MVLERLSHQYYANYDISFDSSKNYYLAGNVQTVILIHKHVILDILVIIKTIIYGKTMDKNNCI